MKYTLWYYKYDSNFDKLIKAYDVFTGTRSQSYKLRRERPFAYHYKVHRCIW